MESGKFLGRAGVGCFGRIAYRYPASIAVFLLLFVAGGMTGGNCTVNTPGGDVPAGGNGCAGDGGTAGPVLVADDHILGDAGAELVVVEYLDFQ